MAFQFSNANTPYYKPEAPELPGRVNMPQGDFVGNSIVNAFVHKAIADEQAQLQQKQMMQQADLQAQHLAYQDKWQQQDYTIAKQNADSLSTYRQAEAANFVSNKAKRDEALKAKQDADQAIKDLMTSYYTSTKTLDGQAVPAAQPLLDPENVRTKPGFVLRGIADWNDQYGGAKAGDTPAVEAKLKETAAGLKTPFVAGADFVNSKGGKEQDGNDVLAWRVPGVTDAATGAISWRPVTPGDVIQKPIQQVADLYNDPVNQPAVANSLMAGGHGSVVKGTKSIPREHWFGTYDKDTQTPALDPWADKLLKDLGTKRTPQSTHVPPVLRYTPEAARGMIKARMTGVDEPTVSGDYGGSDDVESERARAQQAIQLNPQNEAAIRAYFQQKNGEPL